jgi:hypothetical protein
MLADTEGMQRSRGLLAALREQEARQQFVPERVKLSHQLRLPARDEDGSPGGP